MEAFERGEEIEYDYRDGTNWHIDKKPSWDWATFDFRIKPKKQVVAIEKWLCEYCGGYVVVDGNDLNFMRNEMFKQIKLLDTYEVEL